MDITLGCTPVSNSNEVLSWPGAPVVRLSTSTACSAAKFQNEMGALLATKFERTCSMMLRIVRSATPLSEWTCGGHVVCSMVSASRNSWNSRKVNSPALSVLSEPTMRTGWDLPRDA